MDFRPGLLEEPMTGRRWSADEVAREVARRTSRYRRAGIACDDRVLLLHGNRLEFFADLLALWSLGACAVPIDARLTPFAITTLAAAADAHWVLAGDEADAGDAATLAALAHAGVTSPDTDADTVSSASAPAVLPAGLDRDALILFTSGTTGDPKGVVHTHRSLRARWADLHASLSLPPFRRTLCLLPTHFGHGLICNALHPWLAGCDLLLVPPFQTDVLMRLGAIVDDHGVTFLSSVPAMWQLALKTARPPARGSLERVTCGSAPLSGALWSRIQAWTGAAEVLNAYGITETASWVAGTTVPGVAPQDGLIGVGWGTEIRILPSSDTAAAPAEAIALPRGEVGCVWLRTRALMRGYLGRDDLTAAVVRDGWFSTGDRGFVDERGCLFLTGREREEINRGGLKIYPGDIDLVALRHDAVVDACAFPIAHPLHGQDVAIALVLSRRDPETLRSLYDLLAAHLAPHQRPQRWFLAEAIPRSSRGKVNREALAETAADMTAVDLRALLQER